VLLQENNLSSSRYFKVSGYSVFQANRTSLAGAQLLLETRTVGEFSLWSLEPFLSNGSSLHPLRLGLKLSLSQNQLSKACSPLLFLNVYFPPIRNTQLGSRPRTFSPELIQNFPDNFILGNFNAHHHTWDSHISPDGTGNSLFNWFSSTQLDTLNNPNMHKLLHHSSGSHSSPDISHAPTNLVSTFE